MVENPEVVLVFSCGSTPSCSVFHLSQIRKGIYKWQDVSKRNKVSYLAGQRICVCRHFSQACSPRDADLRLEQSI